MKLNNRLRFVRKQHHLKLRELANLTGLSISYLSDMERGISFPSLESAEKIARAYEMDLSLLLTGVEINER